MAMLDTYHQGRYDEAVAKAAARLQVGGGILERVDQLIGAVVSLAAFADASIDDLLR